MATITVTPNTPSVIEPDDVGRAGEFVTLVQAQQFFASKLQPPAAYRDLIAQMIATSGVFSTPVIGQVTLTDLLATQAGAKVGMFGATPQAGPIAVTGSVNGIPALQSLIQAFAAFGWITDNTTTGTTGTIIDGGTPSDTTYVNVYDGGIPSDTPTRYFDGGTP